jgi:hypothetical protein
MLNNALNNNIILAKLGTIIRFNLKQKRLRYISYILNLIAKAYLYS